MSGAYIALLTAAALLIAGSRTLRATLQSALLGWCALGSVCALGAVGPTLLTLNTATLAVATLLGAPGVIGLLLLRVLWAI